MAKLVSDFLTDVKRRAYIPDNQEAFQNADLLAFANQEMQETIYPQIINLDEEYFVISHFADLKDPSGNMNYPSGIMPLPARCFGRVIRELKLVDKSELAKGEYVKYNIPFIPIDDEDLYATGDRVKGATLAAYGYFIVNDGIRLFGNLREEDETIEIRYFPKPATLESSASLHAPIEQINYNAMTGTTLTVDGTIGADFSTYCVNGATKLFDIYRKSSGSLILADVKMTRTDNAGVTSLTTDVFSTGDLVTLAGFQTGGFSGTGNVVPDEYERDILVLPAGRQNYVPITDSMVNLLEIAVVMRYFESQGDMEALQVAQSRYNRQWDLLSKIYDNRNRGEAKKISNRRGIQAFSKNRWSYWGRG